MNTPNEYPNLALIREGIEFRFPVKVRKLLLTMRPLSVMEEDRVSQEVIDEMKKLSPENQTSLKQSALLSIKKLMRAQTSDIHAKDWVMNELELSALTAGELQFIFKEYNAGVDKMNPGFEQFTAKEVKSWVEMLKKNTQNLEMTLIESSFYQLVALCHHLLTVTESPEDN